MQAILLDRLSSVVLHQRASRPTLTDSTVSLALLSIPYACGQQTYPKVELQKVRKVEKARLKAVSKSKPTPTLPELVEVASEDDTVRLLKENRRLAEEVVQLMARVHQMAGGADTSDLASPGIAFDVPGSPPHDYSVDGGDAHGDSLEKLTMAESREAKTRATDASTLFGQSGHMNPTAAPSPSSELGVGSGSRGEDVENFGEGARRVSLAEAEDEARAPSSAVPSSTIKARPASANDGGCQAWNGSIGGINEEEFNRLVEAEAAKVLEELRANPPAHVKALLRVRQELDACAAAAASINKSASIILSSALLPAAVGDDISDGVAVISSSKGAKTDLHEVTTRPAEPGKSRRVPS